MEQKGIENIVREYVYMYVYSVLCVSAWKNKICYNILDR